MYKYLQDLGIVDDDIPQLWLPNDIRQRNWKEQKEIYGFDERETWLLNSTFLQWLYSRLKMYNDINCVDTHLHKYEYHGKEVDFQWCIDKMIFNLEYLLLIQYNETPCDWYEKCDEVLDIFKLCFHSLWW